MGRDLEWAFTAAGESKVSIHAPAWGATQITVTVTDRAPCFNPRARMGRD